MLKIRLQRVGRKHEPVFRLVLTDSKNGPKSGKALEVLGSYDSIKGDKAEFQTDKIKEWMSKGVQLSPTVHNILVGKKVIEGKKINVLPPSVIEETKNKKVEAEKAKKEVATAPVKEVVEEIPVKETPTEVIEPVVKAPEEVEIIEEVKTD